MKLIFSNFFAINRSNILYSLFRSNYQRCSLRKGIPRNFTEFAGKHLCQSLFLNKVVGLRPATLFIKGLWHRCFPVNFAKLLRTPFSQSTSGVLVLRYFVNKLFLVYQFLFHGGLLSLKIFPKLAFLIVLHYRSCPYHCQLLRHVFQTSHEERAKVVAVVKSPSVLV